MISGNVCIKSSLKIEAMLSMMLLYIHLTKDYDMYKKFLNYDLKKAEDVFDINAEDETIFDIEFTIVMSYERILDRFIKPKTYFISGILELSQVEFDKYYVPQINKAIKNDPDSQFILGNIRRGTEKFAFEYLKKINAKMTVYHTGNIFNAHLYYNNIPIVGPFKSHYQKYEIMTYNSHEDILWLPDKGYENTWAYQNRVRRMKKKNIYL